jgi:benzoate membrane transport protein
LENWNQLVTSRLRQSLRDLPRALTASTWTAGLLILLVGFTGSLVLTFQAAENAKLSPEELSSWVLAITVGSGLLTLGLSLWYKQPVICAWSTPGLALLVSSLSDYTLSDAVGAFLVVGLGVAFVGFTGLFDKAMRLIPQPVAMAVLAGVLFKFGLGLFSSLQTAPVIVLVMIAVFLIFKRLNWKTPMALALVAGFITAFAVGQVDLSRVRPQLARPIFIMPTFNLSTIISLGTPLFMLALASQNAPGFVVMKSFGYTPPANGSLVATGLMSALFAPLFGHGFTLAALTAALGNSPDAHPDRELRYGAGVTVGIFNTLFGLFGTTVVAFFAGLPKALIAAMAGFALMGTIQGCLVGAFSETKDREAAIFALLLTASDVQLLGIGSAFWGLVAGFIVSKVLTWRRMR